MRTSLCFSCRTALAPGELCDACGDRYVVSLTDPEGRARACREALREEHVAAVRPPSAALRLSFMVFVALVLVASVGATVWATLQYGAFGLLAGAALGGLVVVCALLSPMAAEPPAGSDEGEVAVIRCGTTYVPRLPSQFVRVSGRIRSDGAVAASLTQLSLAQGEITLRDAVSHGFTVEIGPDRHAIVPPGRVRIQTESELQALPHAALRSQLATLDPAGVRETKSPFPFDRARILELRGGDRITVAAAAFDESWEGEGGYRAGGGVTLRPQGLVWLLPALS